MATSDFDKLEQVGLPLEGLGSLAKRLEKTAMTAATLAAARRQVDTDPSEAQKHSGNYAKGHISWSGLEIAIENPKGSTRSGVGKDGKAWSCRMQHDYGYIKGSVGNDKDHVDVFLAPHLDSDRVFIVNQVDPATREFDECKVILGARSRKEARSVYLANYEPGWKGLGSLRRKSLQGLKNWLLQGDMTKRAVDDTCTVCKEPWRQCLGRHGSRPCACGSGKPRNKCTCPGGTPDPEKEAAAKTLPVLGKAPLDGLKPDPNYSAELTQMGNMIGIKPKKKRRRRSKRGDDALAPLDFNRYGDIGQFQNDELLDYVVQEHNAQRAGKHNDVRFGDPSRGLMSWATRKELPEPGGKIGLFQQPLHRHSYMNFQGTLNGYGSGTVRQKQKGQVKVVHVTPGYIHLATSEDSPRHFALIKPGDESRRWLMYNITKPPTEEPLAAPIKQAADAPKHVPTVAVDLDGTLAEELPKFDAKKIGLPRPGARKWMRKFRQAGARIIVFTVRGQEQVVRDWLEKNKIPFDYINENPDQPKDSSGKVMADIYWDNLAISAAGPVKDSAPQVLERLKAAADEALRYSDPRDALLALQLLREIA